MNFLKSLKINALATSIIYIVLGLLFVILPEIVLQSITVILGVVLALAGVIYIIDYFRRWDIEYRSNGLAIGILLLFGALFMFLQSNIIVTAIPVLLGFAVVISGTLKLQNAIVLNKAGDNSWKYVLALAALCLVLGVVFIVNPFATSNVLIVMIGVGLLISGVSDLVIIFMMSRRGAELKKTVKETVRKVEDKIEN